MKVLLILSGFVVLALSSIAMHYRGESQRVTQELEHLKSRQQVEVGNAASVPSSQAAIPAYLIKGSPDDQAKCARQSIIFYEHWLNNTDAENRTQSVEKHVTNHYDPNRRSCYVEIVTTPMKRMIIMSRFVGDAYEGSYLAEYFGNPNGNNTPIDCEVDDHDGRTLTCDSTESFKSLIFKNYGLNE